MGTWNPGGDLFRGSAVSCHVAARVHFLGHWQADNITQQRVVSLAQKQTVAAGSRSFVLIMELKALCKISVTHRKKPGCCLVNKKTGTYCDCSFRLKYVSSNWTLVFFLVLSFCSKCCNSVHGLHTWIFLMSLGVDVPIGCLQVLNLSRSQHGDAFNLHSFDQTPGGDRCGSKYRGKLPSLCVCSLATYVHLNNRNAAYSSTTQWMKTLKWDEGCVTPLSSSLGTDWLTMPEQSLFI